MLKEPHNPAIEGALETYVNRISSSLLRIELRRLGLRRNVLDRADALLDGVSLIPFDEQILSAAETLAPSTVAALDAIHLATAVRAHTANELDVLMTYDKQLAAGAREHGISVIAPS
jgi:predicted nucleic acid-binding protein